MASTVPAFEMTPNPDFSFPMLQQPLPSLNGETTSRDPTRRPSPLQISTSDPTSLGVNHRRTASTLPNFSFNPSDSTGLLESTTPPPPRTPDEAGPPITPSRRGHRRGASEFVGGDSRFGVSGAVSASPTKSVHVPLGPPVSPAAAAGRRGHAHRRSAALSSHDLGSIMRPADTPAHSSISLPSPPLEPSLALDTAQELAQTPDSSTDHTQDPFGPTLDDVTARPPSRPRVGFSDNVEFIPRPLSTISSETEGSLSTIRGHSGNNSISSVLSLSTPSPPARVARSVLCPTPEDDQPTTKFRSSIEINRRADKDTDPGAKAIDAIPSSPSLRASESSPAVSFVDSPIRPREGKKRRSLSQALGFDRRKSEPLMSNKTEEVSRVSAISLPAPVVGADDTRVTERPSSAQKLKMWASSKMQRKPKDSIRGASTGSAIVRPATADPAHLARISSKIEMPMIETPQAETDLDAAFASQGVEDFTRRGAAPLELRPQSSYDISSPQPAPSSVSLSRDMDDRGPILDLDAALGPFNTPPLGTHRQRREMHSSRTAKDGGGMGGSSYYHRRAESAPVLTPFDYSTRPATQPSMADVFEEEDEEDEVSDAKPGAKHITGPDSQAQPVGIGIQIVDSDSTSHGSSLDWGVDETSQSRGEDWDHENGQAGISFLPQRLVTSPMDRRVSLVDETIVEESSPTDAIQIVQADEEPRSSSLTKSSDSSDTPTIVDVTTAISSPPESSRSLMTPDTYPASTFASPDFAARQNSFDTSRVGTSGSSTTDNRTVSSCMTGEHGPDGRISVDDVPSLTSSRSTMISTALANGSRRDMQTNRPPSVASVSLAEERRRKRSSIQSLSQLMGGSFGPMSRPFENLRPQTANPSPEGPRRKEHRLKKLMFWKSRGLQPDSFPSQRSS